MSTPIYYITAKLTLTGKNIFPKIIAINYFVGTNTRAGAYRFDFYGQEKDDEVAGVGNIMTAEFWEYDARLGRRWNVDPKPDASISNYSCFRNNPLLFNDVDGDTVKYGGLMDKLNAGIGRVFSREFREKFNRWDASIENYTIIKDRYAAQNLENATPNYQLSPSNENENTVRYNSGIGFDDVSSTSLRYTFGVIRIPFSVAKFTLTLPLGVISGLTGQRIPWGAAPNFIDIAHRNKYNVHVHLNLVPVKGARHKFLNKESVIDFYQR